MTALMTRLHLNDNRVTVVNLEELLVLFLVEFQFVLLSSRGG